MTETKVRVPPKLIPVFQGKADIRGAYGGRGSGKTRTFAKMAAIRAYMWEQARREGIILCGRQFMNSLADSSLEEIKAAIKSEDWLAPWFEIGDKYVKTVSGRISFAFTGLDRNVDSVKSKSRILLSWVDEAEPVTEEAWTKLIPTLREEDSELWVTWNPESKRSPTHKRFRLTTDPLQKIVELNYRDNPWFPSILERTRQRDQQNNPDGYEHIWEGGFALAVQGAYYVKEFITLKAKGRITAVPYEPELPVHTAWDLGIGDSTAIWFFQVAGDEVRIIDFYENNGNALKHYADHVLGKKYNKGVDWVPHDAKVRELGTGKTRVETMKELGLTPRLVPGHKLEDGIQAARVLLGKCWFDETKTDDGVEALRQYRTEYKEDELTFKNTPRHDWTSHAADAFRYLAMAWKEVPKPEIVEKPPLKGIGEMTIDQLWDSTPQQSKRI